MSDHKPDAVNDIEALKSVLCNPEGKCCINGSDGDRRVIDDALESLKAHGDRRNGRG